MKFLRTALVVSALLILAAIIIVPVIINTGDSKKIIVVGGKDFTEQSVLAEIMSIMIEHHMDVEVDRKLYLGGTMICFNALNAGDLDLYAEYTGTGLVSILKEPTLKNSGQVYSTVKKQFNEDYNLSWLKPFGFDNTYTLTMRKEQADRLGIDKITDLADYLQQPDSEKLTAGFNAEFLERPDGYAGLIQAYDIEFKSKPRQMDSGLMYKACADGSVDVICAFATDGRIAAYDLVTLKDDKNFFPPYQAAPLVRAQVLGVYPRLENILNRLAGRIDNTTMQKLNYQVDRSKNSKSAHEAAWDFLLSEQLINVKENNNKQKTNS